MPHIAGFRGTLPDGTRDATRALYRYHQVFPREGRTLVRRHLVCAVMLSPAADGMIRPHLAADPAKVAAELARIRETKMHKGMVFAGYRDAPGEADRQFRKIEDGKPTFEQTTADGTVHRLWRVQSAEILGKLRQLFAPKKLHLFGDHARYEAMLQYRDELDAKAPLSMYSSGKYGLFALANVDDPALFVSASHRVVRGAIAKDAIAKARGPFIVEKIARDQLASAVADSVAHQPAFAIAIKGEPDAYKLTLSPDVSVVGEGVAVHRALQKLDPVVVDAYFAPRYLPGATLTATTDLAAAGDADAVIAMRPVPLEQVLYTDELAQRLPADSTAFLPALAEPIGFTVDPDEDLV